MTHVGSSILDAAAGPYESLVDEVKFVELERVNNGLKLQLCRLR